MKFTARFLSKSLAAGARAAVTVGLVAAVSPAASANAAPAARTQQNAGAAAAREAMEALKIGLPARPSVGRGHCGLFIRTRLCAGQGGRTS